MSIRHKYIQATIPPNKIEQIELPITSETQSATILYVCLDSRYTLGVFTLKKNTEVLLHVEPRIYPTRHLYLLEEIKPTDKLSLAIKNPDENYELTFLIDVVYETKDV